MMQTTERPMTTDRAKGHTARRHFRCPDPLYDRFEAMCAAEGTTVSERLRVLMEKDVTAGERRAARARRGA